jgi:hypothetical protein
MALQKTFTLPNGTAGNYIRLAEPNVDYIHRTASAHFVLYVSASARNGAPLAHLGLLAKLRLAGPKFDEWLGLAALAAVPAGTPDPLRYRLYLAARTEPLLPGFGLCLGQVELAAAADV